MHKMEIIRRHKIININIYQLDKLENKKKSKIEKEVLKPK